jgi:O-antigen/teichoic acid export membrane protein
MAMGLLAAIPIVLLGNWLNLILFQGRGSRSLLYLSALSVLGLLMLRSVQTHFQVSRRFRSYGMSDLLNNFIRYGGTALLVLLRDATPWRVIALHALAPLVVTLVLLATLARPLLLVAPSAQAIHEVLHLIRSYLPTAAVGSVTSRIDLFFVTTFASVAQAGIFAAAQTLIIAPQMIGMYLAVVFSPRIMPLWNAGELRGPYLRFQRAAFALSVAGYAVALFTFGPFVHAFLPRTFHAAIIVALILLPAGLSALVNFPWTVSFLLFLRPNFLLKFDLFALPILAVLYVFAVRSFGAAGAAAVTAAYALVKTVALQTVANGILAGAEPSGQLVSSLGDKQVATIG